MSSNLCQVNRGRFLRTMALMYLLVAMIAALATGWLMRYTTDGLGQRLAGQHAARERDRVWNLVHAEVALCRKLADSPVIREWLAEEAEPAKRARAMAELASFRRHCRDQSYFVAGRLTNNFYLCQRQDARDSEPKVMPLSESNEDDRWFYATLANVKDFDLNVDHNETIDEIRIWINTVVRDAKGEPLGVLGTSVSLEQFIEEVVAQSDPSVAPMIFTSDTGAIKVHPHRGLIDQNTVDKTPGAGRTIRNLVTDPSDRVRLDEAQAHLVSQPKDTVALKLGFAEGQRLCALAALPELNWTILVQYDVAAAISVPRLRGYSLLVMVGILLLMIAATHYLYNHLLLVPLAEQPTEHGSD